MTETEWLTCTDPIPMLEEIRGRMSNRQALLFACACCRRIWHWLSDNGSRRALEVTERYADGQATKKEWENARRAAHRAEDIARGQSVIASEAVRAAQLTGEYNRWWSHPTETTNQEAQRVHYAAFAVSNACRCGTNWGFQAPVKAAEFSRLASESLITKTGLAKEACYQCVVLRCIFGDQFRLVSVTPAWLTWKDGTTRRLAQAIYDDRRYQDLPILADALEDAGCDNADILTHCRGGGEHVRGCWVIDLLLGKE